MAKGNLGRASIVKHDAKKTRRLGVSFLVFFFFAALAF